MTSSRHPARIITLGPTGGQAGNQQRGLGVDADGEVRLARRHRLGAGPHVRRDLLAQHRTGINLLGKEAPDNLQGQRRISSSRPRQRFGLKGFAHGTHDARVACRRQA